MSLSERLIELAVLLGGNEKTWLSDLEKFTGVPKATLKSAAKNDTMSGSTLSTIRERRGISANWLLYGVPPIFLADLCRDDFSSSRRFDPARTEDTVFVPKIRVDVLARMQNGLLPMEKTQWYGYPYDMLAGIASDVNAVRIVELQDDFMYPLMQMGDLIMVDLGRNVVQDEAVYAFALGGLLQVSHMRAIGEDRFVIRPENPTYSSFDIVKGAIRVVGECIWSSRIYRRPRTQTI